MPISLHRIQPLQRWTSILRTTFDWSIVSMISCQSTQEEQSCLCIRNMVMWNGDVHSSSIFVTMQGSEEWVKQTNRSRKVDCDSSNMSGPRSTRARALPREWHLSALLPRAYEDHDPSALLLVSGLWGSGPFGTTVGLRPMRIRTLRHYCWSQAHEDQGFIILFEPRPTRARALPEDDLWGFRVRSRMAFFDAIAHPRRFSFNSSTMLWFNLSAI